MGGGRIDSPAGSYAADPAFAGRASFGFISKSARTASLTNGEAEFDLHLEGFRFNVVNFDSQIVNGARVQFPGIGTVNGSGPYRFLLTTLDDQSGSGSPDRFRIKIWKKSTGAVVTTTRWARPTTPIP